MSKDKVEKAPTNSEDRILDIKEVASQLGRSVPCVHRWVAEGLIATVRMPSGLKKVRQSTVNKFLTGTAVEFGRAVIEEYQPQGAK